MTKEYLNNIVNFANNTKGYLNREEIRYLIDTNNIYDNFKKNIVINEYIETIGDLVEVDNVEEVYNIIIKIQKELKGDKNE